MDSTVIVRREDGSSDTWECRDIELCEILTRERRSPLGEAYLLWSDFVHPSMMLDSAPAPEPEEADSASGGSGIALAGVFRLDCGRRNPFDFRIALPGRPHPAIRIGDIAPDHMRRVLARDMSYAKGCRVPVYQHIRQRVGGVSRERIRLLLPVLGAGGNVSEIYGFCRPAAAAREATPGICPRLRPGA